MNIFQADDEPPKSDVRARLALLDAAERRERERDRRHHHRPDRSMAWLCVVIVALVLAWMMLR